MQYQASYHNGWLGHNPVGKQTLEKSAKYMPLNYPNQGWGVEGSCGIY